MDQSLKIGYCGETKIGKSHLAARFIRDFDGIFLDFAGVQQFKESIKEAPQYKVSGLSMGEAFRACKNAGLNIDTQYHYIRSWEDIDKAIDYAFEYRETITKKPNKRIWVVIDDTNMWRWHSALKAQKKNGHKSIVKDDWGQATTDMVMTVRRLESEFNLLFVNQKQDLYKDGENTGDRKGKWYPSGIEYSLDIVGELWVDKSKSPHVQHFEVVANRMNWLCDDLYVSDIINPEPKTMMEMLGVDKELC